MFPTLCLVYKLPSLILLVNGNQSCGTSIINSFIQKTSIGCECLIRLLFLISISLGQNGFKQTDRHSNIYYKWDTLLDILERCVKHINIMLH